MSSPSPSTNKTFTFTHPTLGPLTGLISPDNVVHFRGIPYATIPARFKRAEMVTDLRKWGNGEGDFTRAGYVLLYLFFGFE